MEVGSRSCFFSTGYVITKIFSKIRLDITTTEEHYIIRMSFDFSFRTNVHLYFVIFWYFLAHILSYAHRSHKRLRQRKAVRTQSSRFGLDPCSVSHVACAQSFFFGGSG